RGAGALQDICGGGGAAFAQAQGTSEMNKPVNLIPPVVKSVRVARAQADAFRLYTEGLGQWWPLKTHSIGGEKAKAAVMEPHKGGRLYEVWHDGSINPY